MLTRLPAMQVLAERHPLLSGVYRLLRTVMQLGDQCDVFTDDGDAQVIVVPHIRLDVEPLNARTLARDPKIRAIFIQDRNYFSYF